MTSLFAGQASPSWASGVSPVSSGEQAGGSGLCRGPPTGVSWEAW